tara:strand:+ start:15029 stop:15736 length:708 start_codon:yes stop_codon:yes gene_type:complete
MRTLKFNAVVNGVAQLAGLDRDNLSASEFKRIRDLADGRLSLAWESEYWPEMLRVASATVTSTGGIESATVPSDAGEVLGVYNKDPRASTSAVELSWYLYEDGTNRLINLRDTATPVYMEYRITRPMLTGDVYSSTSTYTSGDQVYSSGHLYDANASVAANESPTAAPAKWDSVKIPYNFQQYLIRGAYADYLKAIGNNELATAADADAEVVLRQEADKLYRQQGQVRRLNVQTY